MDKTGLRWMLPWFLLDGLLYTQTGKLSVKEVDSHPGAMEVLKELSSVVEKGVAERKLQTAPHLVLLSTEFYHGQMKPLLAKWLLFFLRKHNLRKLTDDEAVRAMPSVGKRV